jgi:hypothetical protein
MSRQNKVNPGMYTQRGRLTQDDAARELKRQREVGSQHTWQPVQKDQMPRPPVGLGDAAADRDEETSEDNQRADSRPAVIAARPASPGRKKRTVKAAPVKAKATAAKRQTGKDKKAAAKRSALEPKRKAVLARRGVGGTTKPRPAAKRRKS